MNPVLIYTTQFCGFCYRAKDLLTRKAVEFHEIDVGSSIALRQEMRELSGRFTVPQIFINDQPMGGYQELFALERSGQLDELLSADAN